MRSCAFLPKDVENVPRKSTANTSRTEAVMSNFMMTEDVILWTRSASVLDVVGSVSFTHGSLQKEIKTLTYITGWRFINK